ncbi:hypothetical protein BN2537_6023 [Streptomyces venezuelae]|nr:hypothetical protein BN2537_6023 [Streptomyces venezuelae]
MNFRSTGVRYSAAIRSGGVRADPDMTARGPAHAAVREK